MDCLHRQKSSEELERNFIFSIYFFLALRGIISEDFHETILCKMEKHVVLPNMLV